MRLTKGIIVSKEGNLYRTRIPLLHGIKNQANSTDDQYLPLVPYSTVLNIENTLNEGDIVYISFEEDMTDKPVILGQLKKQNSRTDSKGKFNSIIAEGYARLPEDTIIGSITYSDLLKMKEFIDKL